MSATLELTIAGADPAILAFMEEVATMEGYARADEWAADVCLGMLESIRDTIDSFPSLRENRRVMQRT